MPTKICPVCHTPAPLQAQFCGNCSHRFRTQFTTFAPAPTVPPAIITPAEDPSGPVKGFILSIMALFTCWVPIVGFIFALGGCVICGRCLHYQEKGISIAGMVMSIMAIIPASVILVASVMAGGLITLGGLVASRVPMPPSY
jgi:hypothetical protein